MNVRDKYNVKIIDNDSNGNGITRINNFVVFVSYALKDEELEIEITNINKRYANAKIINIIKPSKLRCNINCSFYNKCGGCNFLHTTLDNEKNIKLNEINKLFNTNIKEVLTNNEYNYRNKATFHVKEGKIGYYSENSNSLVELDNCLLLDNRINEIYNYFKNIHLNDIDEIMVRTTCKELMVIINGNIKEFNYDELINKYRISSIYLNDKLIYGNAYIIEEINNIKYSIYPNAFFQVNRENMIILYDKVKEYAESGNKLLDLYCGTGTISIYLKDNFKEITGIEINKEAIMNANINKSLNNIRNIHFICGDASIVKKDNFDVVIVDPPRSGLSKKVINLLNKINSNRIIYVSCNPNTLKRDIELLNNYNIKNIECVNMFNKTKHIEVICFLERK